MKATVLSSGIKKSLSFIIVLMMIMSSFYMLPAFTASAADIDLVVTDITWSPSSPKPGDQVTFSAVIKNQGSVASPGGTIHGVRFSIGELDNYFAWSDNYTNSIPAGGSTTVTANGGVASATWTATLGTTNVIAWVDDQERIDENNRTNNTFTKAITVTENGGGNNDQQGGGSGTMGDNAGNNPVDIAVTAVSATTTTVYEEDYVKLTATVRNYSSSPAPKGTMIDFYVDGQKLESVIMDKEISGSATKVESMVYWKAPFGTHKFTARINDDKYINENDASNNITKKRVIVSEEVNPNPQPTTQASNNKPDLVVTDIILPSGVKKDDSVQFKATVKNQGNAPLLNKKIGVSFEVDGTKVTWNDEVARCLAAGDSVTLTANGGTGNFTSGKWKAGDKESYTIKATVNDYNGYDESNKGNNTLSKTLSVKQPEPQQPENPPVQPGNGSVVTYPSTGLSTDTGKTMTAGGKNVELIKTRVSNVHAWNNGYPAASSTTVGMFDFSGTVTVSIKFNTNLSSCVIRPTDKGIKGSISGNTVTFNISEAGQFSVEPNGDANNAVLVFANPTHNAPSGNVNTITGKREQNITVNGGQTLYLAPGAVLKGSVVIQSGGTVTGRGIINGSEYDTWLNIGARLPIETWAANGVNISGITILDSNAWNMQIQNSSNVTIDNVKIVGGRANNDGISIQSTDHVSIKNCFIRTWDDGIVVKNYQANHYSNNITAENVVLWTDLAQSMEIGVETNKGNGGNPTIHTVTFNKIYVIHAMHKAPISIHNGDNAAISGIKFTNIYVDDFHAGQGDGWNYLIDITNLTGGDMGGSPAWTTVGARGSISDVEITNVKVNETNSSVRCRVDSSRGGSTTGIKIKDLYIKGNKVTDAGGCGMSVNGASVSFS